MLTDETMWYAHMELLDIVSQAEFKAPVRNFCFQSVFDLHVDKVYHLINNNDNHFIQLSG